MAKTKMDRKVNKMVRQFNKSLREDLFKDRFWVRQMQKATVDGLQYYLYECIDNLHPENNRIVLWQYGGSYFFMSKIWEEMNDLIVRSDFWDLYHANRNI